jgi:hypothetical protein
MALVAVLLTTFVMAALRATSSSADKRSTMSSTARLVWHWQRGVAVRAWSPGEFSSFESDAALRALKRTGATTAVFIVPWYMARPTSTTLGRGPETPTDGSLRHAIAEAKALGLAVVLKPHVEVLDRTFRGAIAPASVSAWFSAYRDFLQHYADLARTSSARLVVIGTELTSMSRHTAQWRELVARVRARFPGRLTFAANQLAGASKIEFWDALDYVGIDAYMPLAANNPNPTVEELVHAWTEFRDETGVRHHYLDQIGALQRRTRKPVLFTELGYRSGLGTAARPWDWDSPLVAAQQPQARAYEAAFRVWSKVPWFRGIYWWDWHAGSFDRADSGYNPRGKSAERVLRAWAPPGRAPAGQLERRQHWD